MATFSALANPVEDSRGLLPARLEKIQVILPLVVLCGLGFFYRYVFQPHSAWTNQAALDLFVASVLLNTVHVGFTVAGQLNLPAYRSWRTFLIGDANSLRFWCAVAIFSFTWLMLFLVFNRVIEGSFLDITLRRWVIFVYGLLLSWHAIHQARGISLMYNRLSPLRDQDNRKQLARKERLGVAIILVAVLCSDGLRLLLKAEAGAWLFGFMIIGLIGAFIALRASHDTDPNWRTNKFFFSLRYLLWPIIGYSQVVPLSLRVLHGLEYALLNWTMLSRARQQMDRKSSKRVLKITVAILGGFFVCAAFASPVAGNLAGLYGFSWRPIGSFFGAFVVTCTLAHMLWDRSYFSLEKTEFREEKAALLGITSAKIRPVEKQNHFFIG